MLSGVKRGMRVPGVGLRLGAVREGGRFWRSSLGRRRRVVVK